MAKADVTQWDSVAANNTDINSIPIDGAVTTPSQVDNIIREMMAQIKSGISSSYFLPSSPTLTTPAIWDTSATHKYVWGVAELPANRTINLPLLTADDEFVFKAFTQTLTNKTFTDATTAFQDDGDNTKKFKFEASGITTATTRTYTMPNANGTVALLETLPSITSTDGISGLILAPANGDYMLVVKAPFGGTITETTTRSVSGTCTATFKINTTALGGTANSVSSSEQSQAQASSNVFAAGDDIVVTISSNSNCVNMSFTIKYTRVV